MMINNINIKEPGIPGYLTAREGTEIQSIITDRKLTRCMEIGSFYGRSTYFICEALAVLNQNTRQYYRWMATQALTNFCIINDIELHLWDNNTFATIQWCKDQDLHVPSWLFIYRHMIPKLKIANDCGGGIEDWPKHTARDFVHFGTEWHDKIAKYMLTEGI